MGKPLQHTFSSFGITLQGVGGLALLKLNRGLTDAEQAHNYHQVPAPADRSVFFWGSSSPVLFFHAALSWKLPSFLYTYQLKNKKNVFLHREYKFILY